MEMTKHNEQNSVYFQNLKEKKVKEQEATRSKNINRPIEITLNRSRFSKKIGGHFQNLENRFFLESAKYKIPQASQVKKKQDKRTQQKLTLFIPHCFLVLTLTNVGDIPCAKNSKYRITHRTIPSCTSTNRH